MPSVLKAESNLATLTFFAKSLGSGDVFGQNGLPILPNSISIMGRSQFLRSLEHPNLCKHLETVRGKHERTVIVSESHGTPLSEIGRKLELDDKLRILYQIHSGLNFMYENDLVHTHLDPFNVLIDEFNNVKLFNYGLHYMTRGGQYVSFPLNNVKYTAPERLLCGQDNIKSDVWSAAIILAELLLDVVFWNSLKVGQIIRKILTFLNIENVLEKIAREHDRFKQYSELNPEIRILLEKCLKVVPSERPLPSEILLDELFRDKELSFSYPISDSNLLLRCSLEQLYYWWQLAGGDVLADLKKEGVIKNEAPILSMPSLVLLDGKETQQPKSQNYLYDAKVIFLSLHNLMEKLAKISKNAFFPLLHTPKFGISYDKGLQKLPLVIRERDTEYQFHRIMEFTRLLQGYPFTRDRIIEKSRADIPPPLRGRIWASILGVVRGTELYEQIDKSTATSTDRQIEVDIPRCHQYDELLSSPTGHQKLKRLLKAWVTWHPQYVYWQGLDSLAAVFLHLNFNDEETAFLSLCKFIPKYLHWFFLKDNSAIIKECLAKFSQLTAFHEPLLASHMQSINFIPELFAIPFFLTMFSHVFPLHKIVHLWDKLMLGDHSYPLFIGISILRQLKTTLLQSGFNECILLFSDLPDIVIETCVTDSQAMYETTPKSICYRKYVRQDSEPSLLDIANVDLSDMQNEKLPRISANDVIALLKDRLEAVAILDVRSAGEFQRQHIPNSLNIPFTSVELGNNKLSGLGVPNLDTFLHDKIVVVVGIVHEHSLLFSDHLMQLGVSRVAVLHKGFNVLHNVSPSILVTS